MPDRTREQTRTAERADSRDNIRELEHLVRERTRYLRLLSEITAIANESPSVEPALARALECTCVQLGWSVGHVYMSDPRDPETFRDHGIWWLADPERLRPFVEVSQRTAFRSGVGFMGRVIESAEAQWIPDAPTFPGALRTEEMRAAGLHAGIAIPILVVNRVAGVMEFFSPERAAPDLVLLEAMSQFGTQIGRIVERSELEKDIADRAVQEQRRIGQELHDTLGQQVTAIEMMVKGLLKKMRAASVDPGPAADRLVTLVEDTKRQVRALSRGMVPVEIGPHGLVGALEDLADQTRAAHGIDCLFDCDRPVDLEDDYASTQLYRIAREATHNAVKHAGPGRILIRLHEDSGALSLEIRDDGSGITDAHALTTGRGLRIMNHRAGTIGASLTIDSPEEGGTRVACILKRRPPPEAVPRDGEGS